jgi:hypothetical protein
VLRWLRLGEPARRIARELVMGDVMGDVVS